jgi:hypothetical protein
MAGAAKLAAPSACCATAATTGGGELVRAAAKELVVSARGFLQAAGPRAAMASPPAMLAATAPSRGWQSCAAALRC